MGGWISRLEEKAGDCMKGHSAQLPSPPPMPTQTGAKREKHQASRRGREGSPQRFCAPADTTCPSFMAVPAWNTLAPCRARHRVASLVGGPDAACCSALHGRACSGANREGPKPERPRKTGAVSGVSPSLCRAPKTADAPPSVQLPQRHGPRNVKQGTAQFSAPPQRTVTASRLRISPPLA